MPTIHKELQDVANEALDLGFGCISDGDHSPFVILIDTNGEKRLVILESASGIIDGDLITAGQELIRDFKKTGQTYALVWDGYLTTDDQKQDAVCVEAGRRGDASAYMFAQKYTQGLRSKKLAKDGTPLAVTVAKHLWGRGRAAAPARTNEPKFAAESVYTILHSRDLAAIYRSGRRGTFKEGKKWITASKLLASAKKAGESVPVIFAPGEAIWELTHWGILEGVTIVQDKDGKWSTTVTVGNLTKTTKPRPNKTQLVVCSTGKKLPRNHIRPYVVVKTPRFLTKQKKK